MKANLIPGIQNLSGTIKSPSGKKVIFKTYKRANGTTETRAYFVSPDFPEPQPTFLSGQEQDRLREQGILLVQVKYNGKFLICTRETKELFNLEFMRNW